MVGVPQGVTPEQAAEAWTKMATRPPAESGTPKDAPPCANLQCVQDRTKHGYAVAGLEKEIAILKGQLDSAETRLVELSKELEVASGVTYESRARETVAKLQSADLVQRRHMDQLSKERDYLRGLCKQAGIEYDEKDVDMAETMAATAGSLGLTGTA